MKVIVAILVSITLLIIIGALVFTFLPNDGDDCPTVRELEMSPFMKIPPECQEMQ
tara:strand:+ start:1626 stop:1790 length:165 start_codon:yes stop_codon:yes gene_type:complete